MSLIVFYARRYGNQRGFSLVEVSIVTAIMLLVAIIGIPAIGSYVIENKVPRVAEELQRFIARVKVNAQGGGSTPYEGLNTAALANALKDSSVISVAGQGESAVVAHGLGGNGRAGNGIISVAPAVVAGGGAGSGFSVRLTNVSHAACPSLASVMQRVAEIIVVEGMAGAVLVKDATAMPPLMYSAATAEAQCAPGERNTFVFTAR